MKLRIDYHVHPNLPRSHAEALKKCRSYWRAFRRKRVNVVIVTEHAYKQPRRAYRLMKETKPNGMWIFPGIECISSEGVDLVVFSNHVNIFRRKELRSYALPYEKLVKFVAKTPDLYGYVTHPYTIGTTSVVRKLGKRVYRQAANTLGAVEISNSSFNTVLAIEDRLPVKVPFMGATVADMKKTKQVPKKDYPKQIKFLAASSDAHFANEIGSHYEVKCANKKPTTDEVFRLVTGNQGSGKVVIDERGVDALHLMQAGLTAFGEFSLKNIQRFGLPGEGLFLARQNNIKLKKK